MIIFNFEMLSMYITLWCHRSTRTVMSVSVIYLYAIYVLFYDIAFSTSLARLKGSFRGVIGIDGERVSVMCEKTDILLSWWRRGVMEENVVLGKNCD